MEPNTWGNIIVKNMEVVLDTHQKGEENNYTQEITH